MLMRAAVSREQEEWSQQKPHSFFLFFKIVQRWDESTHVMCPRQVVHLRMHADSVIFLAGCLEPSASSSSKESFSERSSARFKLCRTLV